MDNIWKNWLEDNYLYVLLGFTQDEESQKQFRKIAKACEKRGISFKKFCEVLNEVNDAQN